MTSMTVTSTQTSSTSKSRKKSHDKSRKRHEQKKSSSKHKKNKDGHHSHRTPRSARSPRSSRAATTAEAQVDTHDLLKYSDILKSVNVYNPSSLVLSSLAFFNDSSSLGDLNQLTGYNLINQTFNDLIGMNLNFFKNFLATQRALYEQQLQSIQPK